MVTVAPVYFRGKDHSVYRISAPEGAPGPVGRSGIPGVQGPTGPTGTPIGGNVPGTDGHVMTANADGTSTWQVGTGWTTFPLGPLLGDWIHDDEQVTPAIHSNKFVNLLTLLVSRWGDRPESTNYNVIAPGLIPAHLRPNHRLWDVRVCTGSRAVSCSTEIFFNPDGAVGIKNAGWTHDWSSDTQIPIVFCYPAR
jgi:hypothetical protein